MQFVKKILKQRSYITIETLSISKKVELIEKRDFTSEILNENAKMFIVYIATLLTALAIQVYSTCQVLIDLLLLNKAPTKFLFKYSDYNNIFSISLAIELPENIGINKYAIELVQNKQLLFRPI